MISVILYGRNDSHGYNLPKRAAISLNCIAEVLSDPDDEILFVDYNTSDDLPTFIEAIYDTLTPHAKSRLRVLRVRPQLHARLVARTHLAALEPHARNIAIRRSNPRNRWVLFTNTDMIFLPGGGNSDLTSAARDLPDGLYVVPRFELPEPLWESFPRNDPWAVMRACEELGPKLHMHEVTLSPPYNRFDQPGDFQLAPRQAMWDIHGFDERMIHGWHADSNMCKRLHLFYGNRTESLDHRIKGYHCDHTRVATLAHRLDMKVENDLQEFVFGLEDPVAHHQAGTWGAPDEPIEETDFANGPSARFVRALEQTLGEPQRENTFAHCGDFRNFVSYNERHVLAQLTANFTVYPRGARLVYAGNNPRMLALAARCVAELGFANAVDYVAELLSAGTAPADARPITPGDVPDGNSLHDFLLTKYDLLIFDFGLDQTGLNLGQVDRVTDWPRDLRYSLGAVARFLVRCVDRGDALHGRIPEFIVINANHYIFRRFTDQFLLASDTPFATHVRKGRPRVGEDRLYRSHNWKNTEDAMRSFFGYDTEDQSVPPIAVGDIIDFTSDGRSSPYKDGHWGAMDSAGTWTDGYRAALLFAPPPSCEEDLLALVRVNEVFIGPEGDPVRVEVLLDGESLTHWTLFSRYDIAVCKAILPARLMAGKTVCRLEFHVENPQSTRRAAEARGERVVGEDPRELGIRIQRVEFASKDRLRYSLGKALDFTENGEGADRTDECWGPPDSFGVWTLGPQATLTLLPAEPVDSPVAATFAVNDVAVNQENPNLDVLVAVNGRQVANWILGPTRDTGEHRVLLPAAAWRAREPLIVSFHVKSPRSPVELGWSTWDKRPLGLRLNQLRLGPSGPSKYRLGDVIDFTDGGNSIAFVGDLLGVEWALPDRYGSWTLGTAAALKVVFDAPPARPLSDVRGSDIPASFVISDCMVSGRAPKLPVLVKANGRVVAEWTLDDRNVHTRSINLPPEVFAAGPELTLTFEIPAPHSPASFGWNTDDRPLGLRLAHVVIGRGDIAIPEFEKRPHRSMIRRILGLPQFAVHVARILIKRYLR
jgi:hypothetical protein